MIARTLLLLITLIVSAWCCADEKPLQSPWRLGTLSEGKRGDVTQRGLTLTTTATDDYGAAFRCEGGVLFTFIAVKKVSIDKLLTRRSGQRKKWLVNFSIDSGDPREEDWVSILSGRVLLVRKPSTAMEIFQVARVGTTIRIDPKYGDDVTVTLPADEAGIFEYFEERCALKS